MCAWKPPAIVRKVEVLVLMRSFARALGVESPSLCHVDADEALWMYREFTAACMEMALGDAKLAAFVRERLGAEALALGRTVRRLLPWADGMWLAQVLYRGIGIELAGELFGTLRFDRCSFAERYTPGNCWLMSAFDEGILCGITGRAEARLCFACRLTEGAAFCEARFGESES